MLGIDGPSLIAIILTGIVAVGFALDAMLRGR